MEQVIQILMKRDGISRDTAESIINDTVNEIKCSPICDATDIIMENLGIEPDYLFDLLQ